MAEIAFPPVRRADAAAHAPAPVRAAPAEPRPLWREQVGDVLRTERREQGRIITEVAEAAGVSPQYLSEIERGRKEPSSEILGSVAGALGLGLGDIAARVAARLAPRAAGARRPALVDLTGERERRSVLEFAGEPAPAAPHVDTPALHASDVLLLVA